MPGQPSANQVGPRGVANGLRPGVGSLWGLREFSGGTRIIFFGLTPRRPAAIVAPSGLSELRSPQQGPAAALGTKAKFFSAESRRSAPGWAPPAEIRKVRNSIFSRALGPRRAPRPPPGSDRSADALPGKCRASCPWGGGERPPPRGGLLVQTPRIFSLAPRCPFLWGAVPGGCPVRGCRFGWGRGARGWCARPCTAPGKLEKNEKMLPPAPRSGIGPCPPHPGAQSRSLAVRKPKNLLPNGKPASAVPRGAPRSPIPRPRPFRAFARRGGANSCAARAPAVALGKARRSPGVVG